MENNKIAVVFNKTASHSVDPQKGFTFLCPDELPVPDGENIVDELNGQNELAVFRTVSKETHTTNAIWIATPEAPQFTPIKGENVDIRWKSHCISGTKGSELLDGLLKMPEYDFIVAKGFEPDLHPYTSCYHDLKKNISTGLIEWYNANGVTTIIVGGLATNYCVGETVIDLANAGFQIILNLGACRGIGTEKEIDSYVDMLVEKCGILVVNSFNDIELILE